MAGRGQDVDDSDGQRDGVSGESVQIELGQLDLHGAPPFQLRKPKPVEDTRAQLAFALVALIGLVIAGLFVLLWFSKIDADQFAKLAGLMLSPLVGLLGAATGYYYGRTSRA